MNTKRIPHCWPFFTQNHWPPVDSCTCKGPAMLFYGVSFSVSLNKLLVTFRDHAAGITYIIRDRMTCRLKELRIILMCHSTFGLAFKWTHEQPVEFLAILLAAKWMLHPMELLHGETGFIGAEESRAIPRTPHNTLWGVRQYHGYYRKTSSISRTKSQSLNVSCILVQLSLRNPLKPDVKLRTKM